MVARAIRGRALLLFFAKKDDVLQWMMNVFGRGVGWGGGVGGVMTFVVICKER